MIYKKDSIVKLFPEGGQAFRILPFGAYTIELTQSGIILAEIEMPDRKELSLKKHSSLNQAVRKVLGNKIILYSERRITGYVSQSYNNIAY